jgi:PKD repeat protein
MDQGTRSWDWDGENEKSEIVDGTFERRSKKEKGVMSERQWMRAAWMGLLLTLAMAPAMAARPAIVEPAANSEVRGDGADGRNVVRWTTTQPPGFVYTLYVTPLDSETPGNPPLAAPVVFGFSPAEAISEGNDAYSRPFDFNRAELQAFGTGLFRVELQATDFTFDETSDPVMYFKGRPIAAITGIDGHDPDAIAFSMTLDDPDATPQYTYSIQFRQAGSGTVYGPFESTTDQLSRTRPDFATFAEAVLPEGQDYALELLVTDTRPANAADPGLTGFLTTDSFHLNAKPQLLSLTGPGVTSFAPAPDNDPTNVTFNFLATDPDHAQVTLRIEISRRDDDTFASGGPFTQVVETVLQRDAATPVAVPIPFSGTYWTVRGQVTDPEGILSEEILSANLTIDDIPTIGSIAARDDRDGTIPPSVTRFDYDLLSVEEPVGSLSGIVDAPIELEALDVIDTYFNPLTYTWNFGDGAAPSNEENPTHTYTRAANRLVQVNVRDTLGYQDTEYLTVTINDRPRADIVGADPGVADTESDAFLAQLQGAPGTPTSIGILWRRYNFVRSGTGEDFEFDWMMTGKTIVCDRRGVDNVEQPTPDDLYFVPGDVPKAVADQGGIASVVNVPGGERLGPITHVRVHGLDLEATFNDPAADICDDAPAVEPGTIDISLAGATDDGVARIDLDAAGAPSDDCTSPPLVAIGSFAIDTSGATADGYSSCDITTPTIADDCDASTLTAPATYTIDTSPATADGLGNCDLVVVSATDDCISAPAISPGTLAIDTAGATADGLAACDFIGVAGSDSCMTASAISPGLLDVDVSAATADGIASCDILAANFADLCSNAPTVAPGTYAAALAGLLADGDSSCDLFATMAADLCASATAIYPGLFSVDTSGAAADGFAACEAADPPEADNGDEAPAVAPGTLSVDLTGAASDGDSSCDLVAVAATDDCASLLAIGPGTQSVDVSAATADGFSTCDLVVEIATDDCTSPTAIAPGVYALDLSSATSDASISMCEFQTVAASDLCSSAAFIAFDQQIGDTGGATLDGSSTCDSTSLTLGDLFYLYSPQADGTLNLTLDGFTTGCVISVHDSCPATSATEIACATSATSNTVVLGGVAVTAEMIYIIRVACPTTTGSYTLTLDGPNVRKDVWYSYTPQAAGTLDVALNGSAADSVLSVHSACPGTAINTLACSITATQQAAVSLAVTTGTTYYIRVVGPRDVSDLTFNLTVAGPGVRKDVWYAYTPRAAGTLDLALAGSAADSVLSVHSACPGTAINTLACSITTMQQAAVSLAVTTGTTYYIRAAGPRDASDEQFDLTLNGPGSRRDVWYSYTPRADGMADLALAGSADDTALSVHSAVPGTSANEIDCDRTIGSTQAAVGIAVTADTTYWIRVAGAADGSESSFDLSLDGPGLRKDVYYEYTPRADGTLDVALVGSPDDAVLSVHSACPATAANSLDCDITSGSQAAVSVAVTADTTYWIRAAGPADLSDETFDADIDGPGTRRDGFLAYMPEADGTAVIAVEEAAADTVLSVHSACPATAANELACTITTVLGEASVSVPVTAGTTYLVRVAGPKDDSDLEVDLEIEGPGVRKDVWYSYTPQADGSTTVSLVGSPQDAVLSVHSACPGTIANEIACAITGGVTQAQVGFAATAGTTYYIRAAGPRDDSQEEFQLLVDGPGVRKDVWYSYTPRAGGNATISLFGSPDDAVLSVHSACPGTLANELDCDRTESGVQASVTLAVTNGTTYWVRIAGAKSSATEAFSVTLDGPGARKDVWLRYVPRADGLASFDLEGSPIDAVVSVHSACPGTPANTLACAITDGGGQGEIGDLAVTADTEYFVRVAGPKDLSDEEFDLDLQGPGVRRDVWYNYTPVTAGTATFTLTGETDDAVLSIHGACPGTEANELDCDLTDTGNAAQVQVNATTGTTYWVRVAGPKAADEEAFTLTMDGPNTRRDVWYYYNPSGDGEVTLSLAGSSAGSLVSVHSDCPGTVANSVAGGVTAASGQATTTLTTTEPEIHYIRVAAPFGGNDAVQLTLDGPAAERWIGDLEVFLMSPTGTQVQLLDRVCSDVKPNQGPFDLDDDAMQSLGDCTLTSGVAYLPEEALAAFNGELSTGNWTLTVTDAARKNVGELVGWSLRICTEEDIPPRSGHYPAAEGDQGLAQAASSFVEEGSVMQTFTVPGVYQFTLATPTEHFDAEMVTGQGDSKTIIVLDEGSLKNAAPGWMVYQ